MDIDVLMFFDGRPEEYALYRAVEGCILSRFPETKIKVQKTQIAFSDRYGFAFVSHPRRKTAQPAILLTLGLARRLNSPRVMHASEPYPGRWTHHFLLSSPDELDGELTGWICEAHGFALFK